MGIFKKIFGSAIFKSSIINTFNSFSSSKDEVELARQSQFIHKRYVDGNHEIEIIIIGGNSMKFKLLSVPTSTGEDTMMFELASENGETTGIDLMMKGATAYLKFPDESFIMFKK